MRISTREAAAYAARREPFQSHGSLYGTREPVGYTVYSYGPHWPLYVYDVSCNSWFGNSDICNSWFGNSDKRSATTSRHASAAMPRGVNITWLSLDEIQTVNRAGFAALAATKRKARLPAYKAGPGDRKAIAEREAEYRKTNTHFIPFDEVPAFAAQKRLFKAPGGLRGDWQTIKKVGSIYVVWEGFEAVAAYDYEAEIWVLSRDNPETEAIAALLPPGVCKIWGAPQMVYWVAETGYAATVAARITK